MVVISIIGVRMTMPKSMVVCAATAALPPAMTQTSNEVPPRSQVMALSNPAACASAVAATTPLPVRTPPCARETSARSPST